MRAFQSMFEICEREREREREEMERLNEIYRKFKGKSTATAAYVPNKLNGIVVKSLIANQSWSLRLITQSH